MKKKYSRKIALLVVAVGVFHVVLFGMRPKLPPVPQTEIVWGEQGEGGWKDARRPELDAELCRAAQRLESSAENEKKPGTISGDRVRFEYRPVASEFMHTGRAVQVEMGRGSSIRVGEQSYPLKAIRFRRVNASGRDAFYLVHQDGERMVVVTVPLQISDSANPGIAALWRYLPKGAGEHNALDDIHLDIANLLPHDRTYYRYAGDSGCGSRLILLGLASPVTISPKQAVQLDKVLMSSHEVRHF